MIKSTEIYENVSLGANGNEEKVSSTQSSLERVLISVDEFLQSELIEQQVQQIQQPELVPSFVNQKTLKICRR